MLARFLINDDLVAHEAEEAAGVRFGVAGRDERSIPHVEPHFYQVLTLLLDVVRLQIVNNRDVIDVASVGRNVPVLVISILCFELDDQLLGSCPA